MSKKCAKCSKTVYPTEELKCLDKVWHKVCFKCEVCGMMLNMKNYKGYDKLPYCNAHYPQTKHTAVADTPEARRIAENTKIQSQVQYHADFEKQKGQKTSVAEDPETTRIKHNTAIQSNVNYWGLREQRDAMESRRPNEMVDEVVRRSSNPGKISDYNPSEAVASPYSQRSAANVVYDKQHGQGERRSVQGLTSGQPFSYGGSGQAAPGSSPPHGSGLNRSSYGNDSSRYSGGYGDEPGFGQERSSYGDNRASYGDNRASYGDSRAGYGDRSSYSENRASYGSNRGSQAGDPSGYTGNRASYGDGMQGNPRVQPGSIADYDPMNQQHSSAVRNSYDAPRGYQPPPPQAQPVKPPQPRGPMYRAMYDYTAADTDEVTFRDGDTILNVEVVDPGWMLGTVQRTGQHGMLPSNYVERVN